MIAALVFAIVFTACSQQHSAMNEDVATPDEVSVVPTTQITTTVATTAVATTTAEATTVVHTEPTTAKTEEPVSDIEVSKDMGNMQESDNYAGNVQRQENSESNDYEPSEDYSNSDVDLIARTVYLESGGCGEYCQWLTASTILNLADRNGGISNVVYDYNTFNVAGMIDGCSPSDLSYSVAQRVVSGDRDYSVMAFRADYYHSFGTPYTNVDNVYFSTY